MILSYIILILNHISIIHSGKPPADGRTPVYRYWAGSIGDHFYTTSSTELGLPSTSVYNYEGIGFYIDTAGCKGCTPLYRYYKGYPAYDHFYTTASSEIGTTSVGVAGKYDYTYEGILGYCYPEDKKRDDMVPLYRYWKASISDHFYTIYLSEIGDGLAVGAVGRYDYKYEGVQCYVWASSAPSAPSNDNNDNNNNKLSTFPSPLQSIKRSVTHRKHPVDVIIPIHEYFAESLGDHFYAATYTELGGGNKEYRYQGIAFYLSSTKSDLNVALHRYYKGSPFYDHFYTVNVDEVSVEYENEGIIGYCHTEKTKTDDMVPIHRYYQSFENDHSYDINTISEGIQIGDYLQDQYQYEGVVCYGWSASSNDIEQELKVHPVQQKVVDNLILFGGDANLMPFHAINGGESMVNWTVVGWMITVAMFVIIGMFFCRCQNYKAKEHEYIDIV